MSLLNLKPLELALNDLTLNDNDANLTQKLKDLHQQVKVLIKGKEYAKATELIKQMYSLSGEDAQIKELLDKVQTLDIADYSNWIENLIQKKLTTDEDVDRVKVCEELVNFTKQKNPSTQISPELLKNLIHWVWDNSNTSEGKNLSILIFLTNYSTELILQWSEKYLELASDLFSLLELDQSKQIPQKLKFSIVGFYFQLLNQSLKAKSPLLSTNFIQLASFIININSSSEQSDGIEFSQTLVKIASLISHEPYAQALAKDLELIDKLLEFNCLSPQNPCYGSSLLIWTKLVSHDSLPPILFPTVGKFLDKKFNGNTESSRLKGHRLLKTIFHFYPTWGISILSQEGWLQDAIETFEIENEAIQTTMLDWLSLSCNDTKFRTALKPVFMEYSSPLLNSSNLNIKLNALLIQSKLLPEKVGLKEIEKLVEIFQSSAEDLDEAQLSNIIEIITYNSLKEDIKVYLSKLSSIWRICYKLISEEKLKNPIIYGICTILSNLSTYPIPLTKEQRQVKQLQAMSNSKQAEQAGADASKKPKILTEEEEQAEFNRLTELTKTINQKLVTNMVLDLWILLVKNTQPNIWLTALSVMLGWATDSKLHSKLLQRGVVPSLIAKLPKLSTDELVSKKLELIQILSKLSIHTDPKLAFNQNLPHDLINLFCSILDPKNKLNQQSTPLQRFESVMALTNLTSLGLEFRDKVFKLNAVPNLELMMLSDHHMLRRTATECLCNLAYCQAGLDYYIKYPGKLHPLMAMTQVEDGPTRLAAGGAIASLSQLPPIRKVLLEHEKLYLMGEGLNWNKEEDPHQQELLRCVELWYQLVEYSKQSNDEGKDIISKLAKDKISNLAKLEGIQQDLKQKVILINNYLN